MQKPITAVSRAVSALLIAAGLAGCRGQGTQLDQSEKKIAGLTATTQAIADAWLNGDVSATYSRIAFRQTLALLDDQRAALTSSPSLLVDPRGGALSHDCERLSRALAFLIEDAQRRDLTAARRDIGQIPAEAQR